MKIATFNIRGTKQLGKRQVIETYMYFNDIDILIIQETHKSGDTRECRKWSSWYFSGGPEVANCHHGVGIIINNSLRKFITDVKPINAR